MNGQDFIATLEWAFEILPFPTLLLYGIASGLVWLFAESWFTRVTRSIPRWRRPLPVLPALSEVVAWLVRASNWTLWLWAVLYFSLAITYWLQTQNVVSASGVDGVLLSAAQMWQQAYALVLTVLPDSVQALPGV